MEEEDALDFYQRITEGKKRFEKVTLSHKSGASQSGFEMHPVDKRELAGIIEKLPDEMFQAVDESEDPEEAEERIEEEGGSLNAVNADTVEAFEDLCLESLRHPDYTSVQMKKIIKELSFEVLFEVGTEIINMSSESTGDIRGFQKQE